MNEPHRALVESDRPVDLEAHCTAVHCTALSLRVLVAHCFRLLVSHCFPIRMHHRSGSRAATAAALTGPAGPAVLPRRPVRIAATAHSTKTPSHHARAHLTVDAGTLAGRIAAAAAGRRSAHSARCGRISRAGQIRTGAHDGGARAAMPARRRAQSTVRNTRGRTSGAARNERLTDWLTGCGWPAVVRSDWSTLNCFRFFLVISLCAFRADGKTSGRRSA